MILTCEKCKTRFGVSADAIPEEGRKVKCSACGHIWHQKPISLQAVPDPAPSTEEPTQPKKEKLKKAKKARKPLSKKAQKRLKKVAVMLLIFNVFLGSYVYQKSIPGMHEVYTQIGLNPVTGLVFTNVSLDYEAFDSYVNLFLTGSVVNEAAQPRKIPAVRISLYDENKDKIFSQRVTLGKRLLEPGEQTSLPSEITHIPDYARTLVLDIGNDVELVLR